MVFTVQISSVRLPKNGRESLKVVIKDAKMELEFPLGTFQPEKQN